MSVFPSVALLAGGSEQEQLLIAVPLIFCCTVSPNFLLIRRKDLWPSRAVIPSWQWRAR